jgi:hypothetical protein
MSKLKVEPGQPFVLLHFRWTQLDQAFRLAQPIHRLVVNGAMPDLPTLGEHRKQLVTFIWCDSPVRVFRTDRPWRCGRHLSPLHG